MKIIPISGFPCSCFSWNLEIIFPFVIKLLFVNEYLSNGDKYLYLVQIQIRCCFHPMKYWDKLLEYERIQLVPRQEFCKVSITEITIMCWCGFHFRFEKIFLLVRRRRLIFEERFLIIRRFVGSPPPSCLRKVFSTTSVAADLNFFLPANTFPVSGATNSIKSAPTLLAAGTTYCLKNGIVVLPIVLKLQILFPFVLNNHENKVNHCLQPFFVILILKKIVWSSSEL